jgi:hypothetical protein
VSPGRRWGAPLVALALFAGGCRAAVTSLDVTVIFDDALHQPSGLAVTILVGAQQVRMDTMVTAPGGRALKSGDDFVILLPDSAAGSTATVDVATVEATPIHGQATANVQKASEVAIKMALGTALDGGVCGTPGSSCCDGGCSSGCCTSTLCVSVGASCSGTSNMVCVSGQGCAVCGDTGQTCCSGATCPANNNLRCRGGTCR